MKKYLLTSMIAMMVAAPAFADDDPYTNSNTYTGYCEIAHIGGTGTGSVNATANFNPKSYSCAAGTYLPDGDNWTGLDDGCQPCPANSYCGGGTYQYSEAQNQGINGCPTGYTLSDGGSTSANACYRTCTTADVPHSANVTGRYYSNETAQSNSCEPTSTNGCVTGYSYVAGFDPTTSLPATSQEGDSREYHSLDDNDSTENGSSLPAGGWSVTWTYGTTTGTMTGIASCNSTPGSFIPRSTSAANTMNTSSEGQYCWCMPTTWTPSGGGNAQSLSAAWVFRDDNIGGADDCASDCARRCADDILYDSGFRGALLGSVGASAASCSANTITINWGGYGTNNTESQSTQCTYGGDVTTPTQAPSKRGHTFDGWTFTLGN